MAPHTGDYVITTSRRTPENVSRFLKTKAPTLKGCQLLVIATEDQRPEIVHGMMGWVDAVIVTEDSISMISEALVAGKKVFVLTFEGGKLPLKHRRFQEILRKKAAVIVMNVDELEQRLSTEGHGENWARLLHEEDCALQRRLEAIL